jgi:hypothetical protein
MLAFNRKAHTSYNPSMASIEYFPAPVMYNSKKPPSLNTDKAASISSMERIRRMIAACKAELFINHDKAQSDTLKLLPAFSD